MQKLWAASLAYGGDSPEERTQTETRMGNERGDAVFLAARPVSTALTHGLGKLQIARRKLCM